MCVHGHKAGCLMEDHKDLYTCIVQEIYTKVDHQLPIYACICSVSLAIRLKMVQIKFIVIFVRFIKNYAIVQYYVIIMLCYIKMADT